MDSSAIGGKFPQKGTSSPLGPIDSRKARFPCCIVWTPIPLISWLIPFIGHIGICREDGVILDFATSNFVCVDDFTFGAVARYVQLNREQCQFFSSLCSIATDDSYEQLEQEESMMPWDNALRKSTQEFQHRSYSIFTCNCHSFVANNLNRMVYGGHNKWNVVNIAALMFLKGTWVSKQAAAKSLLPFIVVLCLGLGFGGPSFLIYLAAFSVVIVGWFLVGTYCVKDLIQL